MAYEYVIEIKKAAASETNDNQNVEEEVVQPSPANGEPEQQKETPKASADGSSSKNQLAAFGAALIMQQARAAANLAINNVGTYTGNSHLQTQVNNAITAGGKALALGGAVISQNYVMAAMMVANEAVSAVTSIVNKQIQLIQESRKLEVSRSRNGYSSEASIIFSRRH